MVATVPHKKCHSTLRGLARAAELAWTGMSLRLPTELCSGLPCASGTAETLEALHRLLKTKLAPGAVAEVKV